LNPDEHLQRYKDMRRFDRTPEPEGGLAGGDGLLTFVVQKHAATRLHYDVRIEVDGVMPSWAVPKGPSYDPKVKRLAMHVEDHPLDYQTFEGVIPKGEYGGGSVIVWDRGTYKNITEHEGQALDVRAAIERGHVSLWLEGEKLRGGWSLTRTSGGASGGGPGKDAWIMVKRKDEHADPGLDIEASAPDSVVTGRSLEAVGADTDSPKWTRETATWMPAMLAELSDLTKMGEPDQWVYERKVDGLRCVAVRNGDDVELWSRNHLSFNARFGEIVDALRRLPADNFVVDGEIVAYDDDGRTSFSLLQRPQGGGGNKPVFVVFDVLQLLGSDTTIVSLFDRKSLAAQIVAGEPLLQTLEHHTGDAASLLERACEDNWEGLIAKRVDSTYHSGRSSEWRKLKCSVSQEVVIGGFTEPKGTRAGFGALLVGYYDGPDGAFRYAGKVGTGFDNALLSHLYKTMVKLERQESPFADVVKEKSAHWIEPRLVAYVAFTEWTRDAKLRHPRFEGLRPDKEARDVKREV